jgi:hypothetical protein
MAPAGIGTISRTATPPFEINRDFAFWDDYAFYGDDGGFRVIYINAPGSGTVACSLGATRRCGRRVIWADDADNIKNCLFFYDANTGEEARPVDSCRVDKSRSRTIRPWEAVAGQHG